MAQSVVGALRVDLSLGTAKFEEGAKKAAERAKGAASRIKSAFGGLKKILVPLGLSLAGITASFLGTAAAVRSNLETMDAFIKKSRQIGLSVEEFTGLQLAAEQSGVSMDELARGMRNVARNVAGQTQQFVDALQAIGVSFEQFAGLSQRERLDLLADKFSKLKESGNKTAIAMKLVGEEMGPRFVNLLNQGSEGLENYRKQANDLGIVISTKAAVAAESFNDSIDAIQRSFGTFNRMLAAEMAPTMATIARLFREWIGTGGGAEGTIKAINSAVKSFTEFVLTASANFESFTVRAAKAAFNLKDAITFNFSEIERRNRIAAARISLIQGDLKHTLDNLWKDQVGPNLDDQGIPTPPEDDRADAAGLQGALARSQAARDEAAAKQAAAKATQELQAAEQALAQLRLEFAGPEEQMKIRMEQLKEKLAALKDGTVEAAEAHELYARAAQRAQAEVTGAYAGMASSVAGSLGKVFTKAKGFAVAQAVIDTYAAFNKALANPPGPPFSYAQAAAALASGFAQVRSILSTNPGSSGGRGGGAATAAGTSTQPAEQPQQQGVVVDFKGELFTRPMVEQIISSINDAVGDGVNLVTGTS